MAAPMEKTRHPGIFKRGSRYVVVYKVDGRQRKESARTLDEARGAANDDALVFESRRGNPPDCWNVFSRYLRPAMEEAGVPWAGFHSLRHTCASILFENGRNIRQVQRWLGHHSPSFTLDTYVQGPGQAGYLGIPRFLAPSPDRGTIAAGRRHRFHYPTASTKEESRW